MSLQFLNLSCLSRKCVGKVQTAENIRISVKTEIADVLSVGVDSAINSYEASNQEVSFYGKTNIRFLYSDGTTVASQIYNADFTASLQSDLLDTDSKLTFEVTTVDSKVETNANTATLNILLEVTAYAYISESVPYLAGGEDVFCNAIGTEYLQSADILTVPLVVDEELNASRNITTVLLAESDLYTTEYTCLNGVLHLVGEATVRLTYISDGTIVTDNFPFKFDRELDASSIDADSQLRLSISVKNTKVRLDISEEANTTFSVEISANVRVEAVKIGVCELVNDAYGANCDFVFERKSAVTTLPCGSTVERKKITANLPLPADKTPITTVNVSATVLKTQSLEKRVQVEGVVYATVLYSTETGTESQAIELPFCEILPVDYIMPQCRSYATACVCELTVRDNGGLQAEAELCFTVESERDVTCSVIVAGEEQPFDKSQLPAIEVCLAHKGETLWSLAKGLHMSEEDLVAVNPEITSPLEQDTRIVVFNKI